MFANKQSHAKARAKMVQEQLVKRHISDRRVLAAMAEIPRHRFVADEFQATAYTDGPLPIGNDQTISQPYVVAFMTQALALPPNQQAIVLEIGTGSGYQAAILSRLAAKVYSVERIPQLADHAKHTLAALGIDNVEIIVADGGYGRPECGPYDGIIVTAAAPEIPAPLLTQLKDGCYLVAPVGPRKQQQLLRLQVQGDNIVQEVLVPVAFVPLLGEHGWAE